MRNRVLIALALLLGGSGVTVGRSDDGAAAAGGLPVKPNILLIVTDDQRANEGSMKVMRKTRRRIARQGQRYRHAFATTPVCCPSRASILTGQYVHNHGVKNNYDAEKMDPSTAMPAYLKNAGYATGLFGKYLNFWYNRPPNFDRWAMHLGRNLYYDGPWNIDGERRDVPTYNADFIAEKTIEFLRQMEAEDDLRPWFAYVTPLAPHAPYKPARRHRGASVPRFDGNPAVVENDRSDKPGFVRSASASLEAGRKIARKQMRSLLAVDDLVARIDNELADLNEKQQTLVIFLSDNGYSWAEHGLLGPGYSKNTPYLPSTKIPMAIRFPGRILTSMTDRRLVANIDVAPTVYDAVGILEDIDHKLDGRSLLDPTWDRKRLLLERFFQPRLDIPAWGTIQTKNYQYTEYRRRGSITFKEFYRLERDPWQNENVLGDGTRKNDPNKKRLHRHLKRLRHCEGSTGPRGCW